MINSNVQKVICYWQRSGNDERKEKQSQMKRDYPWKIWMLCSTNFQESQGGLYKSHNEQTAPEWVSAPAQQSARKLKRYALLSSSSKLSW
jgi:hypothetical protein